MATSMWSWKISEGELKHQVENYNKLKITQSYRGIAVLIMLGIFALSLIISWVYPDVIPTGSLLAELIIFAPILYFVYKGHRWAIITLIFLYTLEKIGSLYLQIEAGESPVMSIIWWLIIMPYFWKALRIENGRKKVRLVIESATGNVFCSKCGASNDSDSKFCVKCGTALKN